MKSNSHHPITTAQNITIYLEPSILALYHTKAHNAQKLKYLPWQAISYTCMAAVRLNTPGYFEHYWYFHR